MNAHLKTPVIVGIGEIVDRNRNPSQSIEPLILWQQALEQATLDSGVDLLSSLDSLELVGSVTWPYSDPVASLCRNLNINPSIQTNASMGGETPIRLVHEAALKISRGEIAVAGIVGGEAVNAVNLARKQKHTLDWTPRVSRSEAVKVAGDRIDTHKLSRQLGVRSPTEMYPLYESAFTHEQQQSPEQSNLESAMVWEKFAAVASINPYAWMQQAPDAPTIANATADNRMICWPYRKLMVANPSVNQSAAILLTSLENARTLGIPEDKIIHIWGGGAASEPDNYIHRDQYHRSTAQEACLDKAVEVAGVSAEKIDHYELYSCFPVVPKMALKHLKLDPEKHSPTVTGGLTFFGGPLNNYMSHAVCAMVRKLRENPTDTGLLYGQGGFVTKHHSLVLSHRPSKRPLAENYSVQAIAETMRQPVPEFVEDYTGPATIETYTVLYARDGAPYQGVVVLRTPDGKRTLARVRNDDCEALAVLTNADKSAVGYEGFVHRDGFGKPAWRLTPYDITRGEYRFISVTREDHLTVVTINRPEVMNCINPETNAELAEAFSVFENDPDQWVAILTGAGEKAFCTGNDLKDFAKRTARGEPVEIPDTGYAGLTARFKLSKPVIAAVNGAAMGGGFEIALACDLIIAADNAVFSLPEPKVGLAALAGGLLRLPRQIGHKQAMGLILTGRQVTASEGERLGFINQVVTNNELMKTAKDWAEQIMACSPMSLKASKAIVREGLNYASLEEAASHTAHLPETKALFKSSDFREGPRAFAEKRAPRWHNEH